MKITRSAVKTAEPGVNSGELPLKLTNNAHSNDQVNSTNNNI